MLTLLMDDEFVTRFKREAQAAGKLNHPNIVNMYDVGFDQDLHYIIMEYVDGETLKEYITQTWKTIHRRGCKIHYCYRRGVRTCAYDGNSAL